LYIVFWFCFEKKWKKRKTKRTSKKKRERNRVRKEAEIFKNLSKKSQKINKRVLVAVSDLSTDPSWCPIRIVEYLLGKLKKTQRQSSLQTLRGEALRPRSRVFQAI